jgi:peptide chain release factor 2
VATLEAESVKTGFWDEPRRAQETLKRMTLLKGEIDSWQKLRNKVDDLNILVELAQEENNSDGSGWTEVTKEIDLVDKDLSSLEFRTMLSGADDHRNAILTIHPGAGGTESNDWAQMLLRMYLRYCERTGFRVAMLDEQPGETAGIKSVSVEVTGEYAYGYLKAENGVHRLVRISPFDFNSRRHTSFASVFVYPEVEEDDEIEINPQDLKIDTFRSSGPGGQHVNRTDSAVRITHLPTNIVATCQSERSQHRNRDNAMKILRAKLYQKKKEEEDEKRQEVEDSKKEIAWGNQIRSYVFHPYNLVKDHRTGVETSNTQAVMDGELDAFIEGFLLGDNGK